MAWECASTFNVFNPPGDFILGKKNTMPFKKKDKTEGYKGTKRITKKTKVFKSSRLSRPGCPDSGPAAFILHEESMGACRSLKPDLLTAAHPG